MLYVLAFLPLVGGDVNLQGFKSEKVITLKGQKLAGFKRFNSRENVTVVTAVSVAGGVSMA